MTLNTLIFHQIYAFVSGHIHYLTQQWQLVNYRVTLLWWWHLDITFVPDMVNWTWWINLSSLSWKLTFPKYWKWPLWTWSLTRILWLISNNEATQLLNSFNTLTQTFSKLYFKHFVELVNNEVNNEAMKVPWSC